MPDKCFKDLSILKDHMCKRHIREIQYYFLNSVSAQGAYLCIYSVRMYNRHYMW